MGWTCGDLDRYFVPGLVRYLRTLLSLRSESEEGPLIAGVHEMARGLVCRGGCRKWRLRKTASDSPGSLGR